MKKSKLFLLTLIVMFACDTQVENEPRTDYQQVIKGFNSMFVQSFKNGKNLKLAKITEQTPDSYTVTVEVEQISRSTSDYMMKNFFEGKEVTDLVLYPTQPFSSDLSNARVDETIESMIDEVSFFSDEQKQFIKSFVSDFTELDYLNDGYNIINLFNQEVIDSNELSEEQKIQLLQISSLGFAFIDFMEGDGVPSVLASIVDVLGEEPDSARVMGCSVNWRNVWASAVIGLTVGAIRGGAAGATVGTFTAPVIGTVAGGVNGAVAGGAVGFVGGALASIGENLLTTCFRPSQKGRHEASCQQTWEHYKNGWVDSVPLSCYSFEFEGNIRF